MTVRTHLYKAIPKDSKDREHFSDGWAKGSLLKKDKTTYCFKEDYDKYPDNTEYFIAFDEMTDWGLPNRHLYVGVISETICEAVDGLFGYEKVKNKEFRRQLFEGDRVNIKTAQYSFKDYVIKYSNEELCWIAVSQREKIDETDNFDSPLDEIKLCSKWEYEYLGNIHSDILSEKKEEEKQNDTT